MPILSQAQIENVRIIDDGVSITLHYFSQREGICIEAISQTSKVPDNPTTLEWCEIINYPRVLLFSAKISPQKRCINISSAKTLVKSCLKDYAIAYRDPSLCEKIEQGVADGRRDECFIRVAELTKDKSLCSKVTSKYYSSICEKSVDNYQVNYAANFLMRFQLLVIPIILIALIGIFIKLRLDRKKKI